jgi:hypothetical protein
MFKALIGAGAFALFSVTLVNIGGWDDFDIVGGVRTPVQRWQWGNQVWRLPLPANPSWTPCRDDVNGTLSWPGLSLSGGYGP